MPGRKKQNQYPKRRPVVRRPRANPRNVAEWASMSCKQTIISSAGADFQCNNMYGLVGVIKLNGYLRAMEVAKAYQFYRIRNVKITYKFPFDTFAPGNVARPNFYSIVDKARAISPLITLESLKEMGAKARPCDDKPMSVSWAPSVLQDVDAVGGAEPAQYNISPWLSTAHQDVNHEGLVWYAEQVLFGGTAQIYHAELELQFEFKKPQLYPTAVEGGAPLKPMTYAVGATRDNSSNGIVDGIA